MIPIDFDGSNAMMSGPPGSDYQPVNVLTVPVQNEGGTLIISRWKFTAEEWDEVLRTKTVWLLARVPEGSQPHAVQIVGTQPIRPVPQQQPEN